MTPSLWALRAANLLIVLAAAWLGARGKAVSLALPAVAALAHAASTARRTVARLRAAQMGEYLSFALFQLRDYAITVSSVAEAIALAPNDPKAGERVERLRKAAGELAAKLTRVLGGQTALTTA